MVCDTKWGAASSHKARQGMDLDDAGMRRAERGTGQRRFEIVDSCGGSTWRWPARRGSARLRPPPLLALAAQPARPARAPPVEMVLPPAAPPQALLAGWVGPAHRAQLPGPGGGARWGGQRAQHRQGQCMVADRHSRRRPPGMLHGPPTAGPSWRARAWPLRPWLCSTQPLTPPHTYTLGPVQGMALLTGPNMAGKSTILRSVCAVALLGACGLYAPAAAATIPYFGEPAEGGGGVGLCSLPVKCRVRNSCRRSCRFHAGAAVARADWRARWLCTMSKSSLRLCWMLPVCHSPSPPTLALSGTSCTPRAKSPHPCPAAAADAFMLRNFSSDSPLEGRSAFAVEMTEMRCGGWGGSGRCRSAAPACALLLKSSSLQLRCGSQAGWSRLRQMGMGAAAAQRPSRDGRSLAQLPSAAAPLFTSPCHPC